MAAHEFPIPITDLDAAGKQYRFPIRPEWVRGALEDTEATTAGTEGELDVRVSKSGNDVVVHGTLKAALSVPCARCLEPVTVQISQPVSALMVPASAIREEGMGDDEEVELSGNDPDVLPYHGETVVLDDLVRDELVLETPMIPLCSEDCPGISPPRQVVEDPPKPESGPVDPRLAPLLRFKKIQENKE